MILPDDDDPSHFVIVRRWDGREVVEQWTAAQAQHAGPLAALAPSGGRSSVMTKVAKLGVGGVDNGRSAGSRGEVE